NASILYCELKFSMRNALREGFSSVFFCERDVGFWRCRFILSINLFDCRVLGLLLSGSRLAARCLTVLCVIEVVDAASGSSFEDPTFYRTVETSAGLI